MSLDLEGIAAKVRANIEDALAEGAQIILDRSNEVVPKESGDLAASGSVNKGAAGTNTVAIRYDSVYAHWIHENIQFKHPSGGQAKFLEMAMLEKGSDAINKAGEHIRTVLGT